MTTTQGVILIIISSVLILSSAESLYSRACAGGDAPEACQKFCELCQTGCIPPGKNLATKTFMDVCDEEQQFKFEQEQNENTKICQELMDGLAKGAVRDMDQSVKIDRLGSIEHKSGNKDTSTSSIIIDMLAAMDLVTVPTAIICVLIAATALISLQARKREKALEAQIKTEQSTKNAEVALLTKEVARLTTDLERQIKEGERLTKESERLIAEDKRQSAERERLTKEGERLTAEGERLTKEGERLTREVNRLAEVRKNEAEEKEHQAKEGQRLAAEGKRLAQERERQIQESDHLAKEKERQTNEKQQLAAEGKRLIAEKDHQAKERDRLTAKGERLAKEANSLTAEENRQSAERERLTKEGERLTAEKERLIKEADRLTKDVKCLTKERESQTEEVKTKKLEEEPNEEADEQEGPEMKDKISFEPFGEGVPSRCIACERKKINNVQWLSLKHDEDWTDKDNELIKSFLSSKEVVTNFKLSKPMKAKTLLYIKK